jgi:hypothetical protein
MAEVVADEARHARVIVGDQDTFGALSDTLHAGLPGVAGIDPAAVGDW